MRCVILSGTIILLLSRAVSAALPQPFSADYYGVKSILGDASGIISLKKNGPYYKYSMRSEVRYLFLFTAHVYDCSVMQLQNNELVPLEHLHREGENSRYNVFTRFDWEQNTAIVDFENRDMIKKVPLDSMLWDPMSIQVKLMHDRMNGRLMENNSYPVMERARTGRWTIGKPEHEPLELEKGRYKSLKITASHNDEKIIIWLSDVHNHIPLQLEVSNVRVKMVSDPAAASSSNGTEHEAGNRPGCKDR